MDPNPPRQPLPEGLPLPPTARRFGWISFANDLASEMVTPLIPLLLVGPIGASAALVGLVEGLAEAASQGLKWASGRWSDRHGHHLRLVVGGYALSNLLRPLLGLAGGVFGVLVIRTLDRVGKGIRTAPRDALLAHAAAPGQRGRAFGFQRALDHLGAALGPLVGFGLLQAGVSLQATILWSVLPSLLTLGLFLRFAPPRPPSAAPQRAIGWLELDAQGRSLVLAATLLALSNLPEALLVVWLHHAGFGAAEIMLVWAAAHVVKTLVAYPAGALADRIGRRRVIACGWLARAGLLGAGAAMPLAGPAVAAAFLCYAAALAASEGAERALLADAAPASRRGDAFGAYAALPGLAALPAGIAFGAVWAELGPQPAFALAALAALLASAMLLGRRPRAGA